MRRNEGSDGPEEDEATSPTVRFLSDHRLTIQGAADVLLWLVMLLAASALRFEGHLSEIDGGGLVVAFAVAGAVQLATGLATGLYLGQFQYGSFEEVAGLVRATFLALVAALVINQVPEATLIPTSAVLAGGAFTLVAQTSMRYVWRLLLERSRRPTHGGLRRVVVVGAGFGGDQLVRSMVTDPASPYLPVALVDDDPAKSRLRIKGVPVRGRLADLAGVAAEGDADAVVVAIPSAGADLIRRVTASANAVGLDVFVLPPVAGLLGERIAVGDVRAVSEADLLGRRVIETDLVEIARYLTRRRVMVTGAGGSIGSELCRQLRRFDVAALVMVDRDESALHEVQLSIEGRALLDSDDLVVADIRDRARLREVFAQHRPEVVFHTAALKHLPLLERHPEEAVKTNVWGTQNVLTVAAEVGVERFVNVSTDKAAHPSSVLGYTKRLAEALTAGFAAQPGRFVSVRFGNVLGSRGSVLTAFRSQIDHGGPVTVTAPDVTRYFMLVEEAVQLVIQAGAMDDVPDGATMILDMGQPVSIQAVAEALIAGSGRDIEIVHTGLRPGEKRHEVLFADNEATRPTAHDLITRIDVPPVDAEWVAARLHRATDLRSVLADLCATLTPPADTRRTDDGVA